MTTMEALTASTNQNHTPALRLNPWKHGYRGSLRVLEEYEFTASENNANAPKNFFLLFDESRFEEFLKEDEMISLFVAMCRTLSRLESVTVQLSVESKLPPTIAIPPIQALTCLLSESKIKSLTLLGLQLIGSDIDCSGFAEAIRIHPTLKKLTMKDCLFHSELHVRQLGAILDSKRIKHADLLKNNRFIQKSANEIQQQTKSPGTSPSSCTAVTTGSVSNESARRPVSNRNNSESNATFVSNPSVQVTAMEEGRQPHNKARGSVAELRGDRKKKAGGTRSTDKRKKRKRSSSNRALEALVALFLFVVLCIGLEVILVDHFLLGSSGHHLADEQVQRGDVFEKVVGREGIIDVNNSSNNNMIEAFATIEQKHSPPKDSYLRKRKIEAS